MTENNLLLHYSKYLSALCMHMQAYACSLPTDCVAPQPAHRLGSFLITKLSHTLFTFVQNTAHKT